MDFRLSDEDFKGNQELCTTAQFDMDYLERISSDSLEPSELSRQSLYVKFDPLVGANSTDQAEQPLPSVNSNAIVDALLTSRQQTLSVLDRESSEDSNPATSFLNLAEPESTLLAVTSNKELKYSEDEVAKMLKKLMDTEAAKEADKYNEELAALQRELLDAQEAVAQLKSGKGLKAIVKQTHRQDVALLEQEHQQWEALSAEHGEVETVIVDRHEERKKSVLSHQDETVSAEKSLSSLEHSLEDLLQRYASLRDQSTNLENCQNKLKEEIEDLQAEAQRLSVEYSRLDQELMSLVDKGNSSHESLQKEVNSKLAVDRVTTKKLELQVVTLGTEQQNKERDKEQLTKICDELLQELNQTS